MRLDTPAIPERRAHCISKNILGNANPANPMGGSMGRLRYRTFSRNIEYTKLRTTAFQVCIPTTISPSLSLEETWKLIQVDVQDTPTSSQPPPETDPSQPPPKAVPADPIRPSGDGYPTGQSSTRAQRDKPSEDDEFGTTVEEVTVVTTTSTITTRKKHQGENS